MSEEVKAEEIQQRNDQVGTQVKTPYDFSLRRKWLITLLLAGLTWSVTFSASAFSGAIGAVSHEFHTSETVAQLGIALYVLGSCLGPLLWGPLSELYGRRGPLFLGFILFALFQIPVATVQNLPGIIICRFIDGFMGSAPVVIILAQYADFWHAYDRGTASAVYSWVTFAGPSFGPIVGVYATITLNWRWTAWLSMIMAGTFGIPAFLFVPETYGPALALGKRPTITPYDLVQRYLIRPVRMVRHEFMLNLMTLYVSLVYGILFLTFFSIPYTFSHERGWASGVSALPFLSAIIGVTFASFGMGLFYNLYYQPRLKMRGTVLPEDRLPPVMVGSVLMPVGLFWLAWSSHTAWIAQVISISFIGAGEQLIFSAGLAFIIDVYSTSSASALATNCFARGLIAAALPIVAPTMYRNLGPEWATSLLGFLCAAMVPAPFLFHAYGPHLRKRSRFAVADDNTPPRDPLPPLSLA